MYIIYIYNYIYIYIHIHVFRHSQDSSVRLRLMSREQLMSPECSKHQVLSFAKMLVVWWTNKKYSVLISVLQSAQWINSEHIYPHTHVSSFPGRTYISYIYKKWLPVLLHKTFSFTKSSSSTWNLPWWWLRFSRNWKAEANTEYKKNRVLKTDY